MLMVQHCFWSCTGIFLRAKALSPSSVQKNPWSLLGTDRSSKDGFRSALFDVAKSIPVVLDANWLAISKCFKDHIHTFLSSIFHPTWDDDPNSLTFLGSIPPTRHVGRKSRHCLFVDTVIICKDVPNCPGHLKFCHLKYLVSPKIEPSNLFSWAALHLKGVQCDETL